MQRMPSLLPSNSFTRPLYSAVDVLTLACGWWLIGLSVATCVEMAGRKLFGFSLQGVDEVGGYTFAILSVIGFSYTLLTRGHTRVDFFVSRYSEGTRAVLNLAATLTLAALAMFAAYRASYVLADTVGLRATAPTPLATPLWIPQSAWLAGLIMFAAVTLFAAVDGLLLMKRKAWEELNRRHGPQTLAEEIESETSIHLERGAGPGSAP
jgi:TRAP-type C4-dicarboxylate transport system permease small subunit